MCVLPSFGRKVARTDDSWRRKVCWLGDLAAYEGVNEVRLGILASHNGSNMQAVVDACKAGELKADPVIVISNNPSSKVLRRAAREGVRSCVLNGRTHPATEDLDRAMLEVLMKEGVDLLVLAGYMKKLGPRVLREYWGRILNTHPALLPKFGGKGMWGDRVHEAVLSSGDSITGATVHVVTEDYDEGPIVAQVEVPVRPDDTVGELRDRVLVQEHRLYVDTLKSIVDGSIDLKELCPPGRPNPEPENECEE